MPFLGKLDHLKFRQIIEIIESLNERPGNHTRTHDQYDGFLAIGSDSQRKILIRFNSRNEKLPDSAAFRSIVSILKPELIVAANQNAG